MLSFNRKSPDSQQDRAASVRNHHAEENHRWQAVGRWCNSGMVIRRWLGRWLGAIDRRPFGQPETRIPRTFPIINSSNSFVHFYELLTAFILDTEIAF